MSDWGDVGNGFDFQINPYFFGGNPGHATSVPYPIEAEDSFNGRVEGAFEVDIISLLEDFESSSEALSGTLRDTLIRIYEGPDSIDSITAEAQSGTLDQILRVINPGPEEIDSITAVAREGTMRRILIVITMETDSFNGAGSRALSGTLV